MSRFWAAASSSSESGSDSDDSSVSSASSEDKRNENRWVMSDDSESEDEIRVVKSAKDRTFESMRASVILIRNAMKVKDYAAIQDSFDSLVKNMGTSKSKSIIEAHGGVPRFIIRILCDLEDFIASRKKEKAAVKKLSAKQGRALNRMGLSLKKHNKQYERLMTEYRENPILSDNEASSDSDSDSDSDSEAESASSNDSDDDSDDESETSKKSSVVGAESDSDSVSHSSYIM